MAVTTKLGVALVVALASNATLLSLVLRGRSAPAAPEPTVAATTTTTPATIPSSDRDSLRPSNLKIPTPWQIVEEESDQTKVSESFDDVSASESNEDDGRRANPRHKAGLRHGDGESGEERKGGRGAQGNRREEIPPRSERSTLARVDTGHHLEDVIASLTETELEELGSRTSKILIPALIGLESMVLQELERLHDVSVHQELRLEMLEKRQLQEKEIMEAANVIREEQYLLQRKQQQEALKEQESETPPPSQQQQQQQPTSTPNPGTNAPQVVDFEDPNLELSEPDGSGSGDESLTVVGTSLSPTTTTAPTNQSEASDNGIINHIYEIYSSLTSMEHKVMELGTSLTVVSTELYRQRATFVRLEDKVEEIRRNQRTLVMKSTIHSFKLTDLEQFKGQAELLMRTAEGAIEQFETKLEIFKDRVTEQQDEVQVMRGVFSRLEQSNNELRAADAYKAHDIQELKRAAQQVESRLSNLYHSLDRYVGNVRWDVKTYLDHLCANNNLNC